MFCTLRFQVNGLIEGQWYAYRIRALNKLGASRPCRATDEIQAVDARGEKLLVLHTRFWLRIIYHSYRCLATTTDIALQQAAEFILTRL